MSVISRGLDFIWFDFCKYYVYAIDILFIQSVHIYLAIDIGYGGC